MARLQEYYKDTVVPQLKEQLGLDNVMEVPRITKITLNMGIGEAVNDKKLIEKAVEDMTLIARLGFDHVRLPVLVQLPGCGRRDQNVQFPRPYRRQSPHG